MITQSYFNKMLIRSISSSSPIGTILFIHGLGESGLCFENTMEVLSEDTMGSRWNLVTPDLPGYGKSLPPNSPMSLKDIARQIPSILKDWLQPPIVILGHSMGGVIGQMLCASAENNAAAFINVEGNLSPGDCVFSGQAAQYTPVDFVDYGFNTLKNSVFANGAASPAQRGYYASMRLAWAPQFYRNSLDLLDFSAPRNAVRQFVDLPLPKLYIAGQPRGICAESLDSLTHLKAPMNVIPDAGHWPFIDQPDLFMQALIFFLNSISSPN